MAYTDPLHPLRDVLSPEEKAQRDLESDFLDEMGIPNDKETPLSKMYKKAHEEKRVSSLTEWATFARGKKCSEQVARGWKTKPGNMTKEEVERTCELFGCSIEQLRGQRTATIPGQLTDINRVMKEYESLSEQSKRFIASAIDHLFTLESMYRRLHRENEFMGQELLRIRGY